jgi:putative N6-adenine-specific DNA methylase
MTEKHTYIAKTMHGLEPVLVAELEHLGATEIRPMKRAVSFSGDKKLLYRANYELRTALRILIPIRSFEAMDEREYYHKIQAIDWSRFMLVSESLAIDAVVQGEVFRHSQYTALLTKDAIVDQFRERYQRRPDVNTIGPHLRINVHIHNTTCEISLDSSGDSLHRRGYRRDTVDAPISEVLAAGLILISGWDGQSTFVDSMCGSGTLAIEAALLMTGTPPQFKRQGFGFFKWHDFDKKIWDSVVKEAADRIKPVAFPIIAADIDNRARNSASINVMSAGLESAIEVIRSPFDRLEPPRPPGILITNPPYDERLLVEDAAAFYQMIGDTLKKRWTGWKACIFSANREAMKSIGLRTSSRTSLFNGSLDCSFQQFELYEGSKVEKLAE